MYLYLFAQHLKLAQYKHCLAKKPSPCVSQILIGLKVWMHMRK